MIFFITIPLWLGIIIWIISAMAASGNRKRAAELAAQASREALMQQHRLEWLADQAKLKQQIAERAANKTCPMCAERIKREARICRFCQHIFPAEEEPLLLTQLAPGGWPKRLEAPRPNERINPR